MRALPLLVVVCLMAKEAYVTAVCHIHANGCSIPGNLPFFYKRLFTPACNRHNVCYGCGAAFRVTKARCDLAFLYNMRAACGNRRQRLTHGYGLPDRRVCDGFAQQAYYNAVRIFGHSYYRPFYNHDYYCSQNWVPSCLPGR